MSKMYVVQFTGVAVTAQQDLFEFTAATDRMLCLHGFDLSQSTEVGDAQEEGLSLVVKRGTNLTTSGNGSAATPVPLEQFQGAAGFAAEVNGTTKLATGTGTITTVYPTNWNVRNTPCQWIFTPEQRIYCGVSQRLAIELATTPADSITMSGAAWLEEIG